jgi:hypothetical protein
MKIYGGFQRAAAMVAEVVDKTVARTRPRTVASMAEEKGH